MSALMESKQWGGDITWEVLS